MSALGQQSEEGDGKCDDRGVMEEWWSDGHGFNLCVAPSLVNQLYINFRDTKKTGGRQNKEAGIYKGFYLITTEVLLWGKWCIYNDGDNGESIY